MFCPKCQIEMLQANKEGVIIDVCQQCRGVWLDHGELEKIMSQSKQAMVEYDELYKFYDKHKHPEHSGNYSHKGYKKKQGVFGILGDLFD